LSENKFNHFFNFKNPIKTHPVILFICYCRVNILFFSVHGCSSRKMSLSVIFSLECAPENSITGTPFSSLPFLKLSVNLGYVLFFTTATVQPILKYETNKPNKNLIRLNQLSNSREHTLNWIWQTEKFFYSSSHGRVSLDRWNIRVSTCL
jgi:hypothetical protein